MQKGARAVASACKLVPPARSPKKAGLSRKWSRKTTISAHWSAGEESRHEESQSSDGLAGRLLGLPHVVAGHGRGDYLAGAKNRLGLRPLGGRTGISRGRGRDSG